MTRTATSAIALTLSLLALIALAASPTAGAQNDNNAGTVKVHDNEDENPDVRNVPHVSCDFWVEGFNMNDDSGVLVFYAWPPTGDITEVTPDGASLEWESDGVNEQQNHHFLAGPFQLEKGHYRLEVLTDDGHPGGAGEHMAKAKTFWVEPCDEPPVNPPCPAGLVAAALVGGNVTLTWTPVVGATAYNVYRAVGEEDFEFLASVEATAYLDNTTQVGVTYSYYVTAFADDAESIGCEAVEVTAIPVFPTAAIAAIATVGAVGAFVLIRRRL